MKNQTIYLLHLLLLSLFFSCVQEEDILTGVQTEIISQEGELSLINGIVRDTSGAIIPQASIKIIFEEFELETVTNNSGEWNIEIPNSLQEGFIVANKIDYSKSIQRLTNLEENSFQEIFLAKDALNSEVDLSLTVGNLRTVKGMLIDGLGSPASNVNLFLLGITDSDQLDFKFMGFQQSGEDGNFEIIYEDDGFDYVSLFGLVSIGCRDLLEIKIEGKELVKDLGLIDISSEAFSKFQANIESDGSSCFDNAKTLAYYLNLIPDPIQYDQPLGAVVLEYCPVENGVFYIGVESEGNIYFNGSFIPESDIKETYVFDICTPNSGNFLELNINGELTLFENNLLFAGDGTIVSGDQNTPLEFGVFKRIASFEPGTNIPRYEIGEFKKLTLSGNTEVAFNNFNKNVPQYNYVNIVQDDDSFFSGIGHVKATANDGSETDIKIRFRVAK